MQNFKVIEPLFMKILHFKDLGDTSVISECSLGVTLVIDNFFDVASDTLPLYNFFLKAIGPLLMEILHFEDLWDTSVQFGC